MASTSAASLFVVPRSQTPQPESSSSESEEEEVVERKRGQNYPYEFLRSFEKKCDFDAWWGEEKAQWTYAETKWTKADCVETWYCKFAGKYSGRTGVNCNCCLRIFFPQTSDAVIVKRRMVEHDHSAAEEPTKLSAELKGRIKLLSDQGWMPKRIHVQKTYFPHAVRIMCFAHVIRRFDAVHKPKLPKHLQEHMRSEICLLQYARNDVEFTRMAEKLLEVWRDEGDESIEAFCDTFASTYIHGDLRLWHEGATDHCVNNNGLECANLSIKRDHTLRRMLAFATFLEKVEQLVRYWSIHAKPVIRKPSIPLKVQKAAYDLQKECDDKENGQQKRLYARIKDTHQYVFASASSGISSLEELFESYNRSYVAGPETWGDYSECRFEVYLVQPAPRFGNEFYVCTCRAGSKKEVCKHVAMVMCGLESIVPYAPEVTAKEMQHNRKEKRKANAGRTPLAKRQNRYAAAP